MTSTSNPATGSRGQTKAYTHPDEGRLVSLKRIGITLCLVVTTWYSQGVYARKEPVRLWAQLKEAAMIHEGHGAKDLYVFFDPDCPYCHQLYENLQPLIGPKGLEVRWLPVGILKLSSFGKAAHLLEAKNPAGALARAESGYRDGRGLAVTPRRATFKVGAGLVRNARLLNTAGGNGVPFLVYKDQEGRVRAVVGNPPREALLRIIAHLKTSVTTKQKRARP